MPRRRVRVAGSVDDARRLRERLRNQQQGAQYASAVMASPSVLACLPQPQHRDPAPTLGEWAERLFTKAWLHCTTSTLKSRRITYRLRIEPFLAGVRMDEVSPEVIEDWTAVMVEREGRTKPVEHAWELLYTMLAVWHGRRGTTTPMLFVSRPHDPTRRTVRARDRVLTHEQYHQLIAACIATAETLLVRTAVECGLRRGELCALQRGDIDTTARIIRVERQATRETTKSGHPRTVAMNSSLAALYVLHLGDMTTQGRLAPEACIWTGHGGYRRSRRGLHPAYYPTAMWKHIRSLVMRAGLVDAAGRPLTTPHGLRATGATLAAQAGVAPHIIQHQLGHTTLRVTENHYIGRPDPTVLTAYAQAFM